MMGTITAEFRKIFTLRSTYVSFLLTFAVLCLFGFYVEGLRSSDIANNPFKIADIMRNIVSTTSIFAAIIGILLVTHEYRYNTIMHTLTLSSSRLRVLLAKLFVVSVFSIIFTIVSVIVGIGLTRLGLAIGGNEIGPQTIYYADILWRIVFFAWAYCLLALLIAVIVRNQVGAIVGFFLLPSTIEPLLGLLLKTKAAYLPFNLLGWVINGSASGVGFDNSVSLSVTKAAVISAIYLAVGWAIAAVLFVRRDAN